MDTPQEQKLLSEVHVDKQEEQLFLLMPCIMDIGEALLEAGADVRYVERTLASIGYAYGAKAVNAFVITALMVVTVTFPSGRGHTLSRRIETAPTSDFDKLQALCKLCDECRKTPLPLDELEDRFHAIEEKRIGDKELFIGGIVAIASFAVFFGGSWLEALVAALVGVFVCITLKVWRKYIPNTLIYNFAAALASGILIYAIEFFVKGLNSGTIIAGVIMILIPGIAMTNAIRDLIAGDTLTGIIRLVESLLWALALALGFIVAMIVMSWVV